MDRAAQVQNTIESQGRREALGDVTAGSVHQTPSWGCHWHSSNGPFTPLLHGGTPPKFKVQLRVSPDHT